MSRDAKLITAAVVAVLVAVILLARGYKSVQPSYAQPPTNAQVQKQIADIEANPHMPAQAKAAQIGQLRAHMGVGGSRQ